MTNCDGASDVDSRQTEHRGVRWYMLQVYGLVQLSACKIRAKDTVW